MTQQFDIEHILNEFHYVIANVKALKDAEGTPVELPHWGHIMRSQVAFIEMLSPINFHERSLGE